MTSVGRPQKTIAIALLGLTVVAVWTIRLFPSRIDPCRDPVAIADLARIAGTEDVVNGTRRSKHTANFLSVSAALTEAPHRLRARLVRSYDAALTAANWDRTLKISMGSTRHWSEEIEVEGTRITVRWDEEPLADGIHFAGRLIFIGNEQVSNMPRVILESVASDLFSGTEPTTLYVVEGVAPESYVPQTYAAARDWIRGAAQHHHDQCAVQ